MVFNTSMTGYQEILTDPSYVGQIVTMAYPRWATSGANPVDEESRRAPRGGHGGAHAVTEQPSNWRAEETLDAYLRRHGVVGIEGIDTRRLVRHLRTHGAQMGVISTEGHSAAALVERAPHARRAWRGWTSPPAISTKEPYVFTEPTPNRVRRRQRPAARAPLRRGGLRLRPQEGHAAASWWTRAAA